MGPLAGIGDSIDWATLKPIIFALAATLSATGSPVGCFVLLALPVIQIAIGLNLSVYGYKTGRSSIREILNSGHIKELILGASTLGLFMMGALSSTYVKLSTPFVINFGRFAYCNYIKENKKRRDTLSERFSHYVKNHSKKSLTRICKSVNISQGNLKSSKRRYVGPKAA